MEIISKTINETPVFGRTIQEVRTEVELWIATYEIKIMDKGQDFIKGRTGNPIFYIISPRYFYISFKSTNNCIIVYTEGYYLGRRGKFGFCSYIREFSAKHVLGIPIDVGWSIITNLWDRLSSMSILVDNYCWNCNKIIQNTKDNTCPKCGYILTAIE